MTPRLDRWGDEVDDDTDDGAADDRDWTPPAVPTGPLLPPTPQQLAELRQIGRAGRSAHVDDVATKPYDSEARR